MTNIFEGLKNIVGETKLDILNADIAPEFNGVFTLTKGGFIQTFNYYSRLYKTRFENLIEIDDYDINDGTTTIHGIKIDSLEKLKNTLKNSGLSTLADTLGFDSDERKTMLLHCLVKHPMFKKIYGNAKLKSFLTKEELEIFGLEWCIKNHQDISIDDISYFGIAIDADDIPSLEQLTERLSDLMK